MNNKKKIVMAMLALSGSAAFAGTMGPACVEGNVTVPCASSAWDFGVQALYLKPAFSDRLAWAGARTADTDTGTTSTNTESMVENDLKWRWGFKLEGSYHFDTGNDLNLNWYHMGRKSTTEVTSSTELDLGFQFDANEVSTRTAAFKPAWDAVNLEFGQHVNFGERKNIRFHGGVQYARITTDRSASLVGNFAGVDPIDGAFSGSRTATSTHNTTYNGFGPRVGADMSYDWNNGLAIYANSAAALLTGKSKYNRSFNSTDNTGGVITFRSDSSTASKTAVVPELEAKLGLTYTYAIAQGDLTLDAGYMWVNYFSAQTIITRADVSDSNFSVQGPFVGLKWVGNV